VLSPSKLNAFINSKGVFVQILQLALSQITIPPYRQRKEIEGEALGALMASIEANGLLQPIVVRSGPDGRYTLVAGHRRLSAISNLVGLETRIRYGTAEIELGSIPAVDFGELDQLAAEEAELEENVRRVDLTWEERAAATGRLADLRSRKARALGGESPSVGEISVEVRGSSSGPAHESTRRELILAPLLAAEAPHLKGTKSLDEAWKAHLREEDRQRNIALGQAVGATFGAHSHTLVHDDCIRWIRECPDSQFDVIITDPPYGVGANDFGDAGGRLTSQTHSYDDSPEEWQRLIGVLGAHWFRVAKPQAHLYVCCDIDGFSYAREWLRRVGWNVHRTPLVNFKRDGSRVPWPQHGPQRKWELVLYAEKGRRPVTRIYPDVIETKGDENLGHGAQKPVELYKNLLVRSVRPGDSVLDCFGGTGTVLVACHELQCKATYVEAEAEYYGVAVKRLETLE